MPPERVSRDAIFTRKAQLARLENAAARPAAMMTAPLHCPVIFSTTFAVCATNRMSPKSVPPCE